MALSVEDGERIARAVVDSGLQLFVGHILLHHPAIRKLRALVSDGVIGRVWHVRSRRLSLGRVRANESVWWSFAPHDVALALAIMGEEPQSASATQTGCLSTWLPDTAYADFRFSNGRSAHVEVGWLDPCKSVRLDVFGTEGVLTFEDSLAGHYLTLCMAGAKPDERGIMRTWRGEARTVEVQPGDPLREELGAFLTSIRFGIPAETDVHEGLAVLRALTMADDAAQELLRVPLAV
jgi:UDP-2-acetamido-3-amino-2,3-dideoxy-glucuronate N-acetyltransferase